MAQLAVQLFSVRDRMASDAAGVLKQIADIGYPAVEPYDVLTDPTGLRATIYDHDMSICSVHAPTVGESCERALDAAAAIGCRTVIVGWIPADQWADRAAVEKIANELNEAARHARARNLRLGYHNHYWELHILEDGRPALEHLADLLSPDIVLEVDIYWAYVGGVDVPALLERLGDRVRYLHVKDGPGNTEDPMTAVGRGVVPIQACLAAAKSAEWHIVELDSCATDTVQALADSYSYLQKLTSSRELA